MCVYSINHAMIVMPGVVRASSKLHPVHTNNRASHLGVHFTELHRFTVCYQWNLFSIYIYLSLNLLYLTIYYSMMMWYVVRSYPQDTISNHPIFWYNIYNTWWIDVRGKRQSYSISKWNIRKSNSLNCWWHIYCEWGEQYNIMIWWFDLI